MENPNKDQFDLSYSQTIDRPDFLKILCILSFVCCGLMILVFSMGLVTLFLSEEMINKMWENVIRAQPQLESIDRFEFFHRFGIACVFNLIGNIVSLIGVILMWQLKKAGFFIYAIAELAVNFFGVDLNTGTESASHAGLIFMLLIDLVFIMMYASNLKYMNGREADHQNSTF